MNKKKKEKKRKKKKKKSGDFGSSRHHLSSGIHYAFNTKMLIYHAFGKN